MPRVSAFYGIVIYIYRPDHPPAHFHAQYSDHWAAIAIGSLRVLDGSLPPRAARMVRQWARLHREELLEDWNRAVALDELVAIDPLP